MVISQKAALPYESSFGFALFFAVTELTEPFVAFGVRFSSYAVAFSFQLFAEFGNHLTLALQSI
jgi:hypothetical protein